MLFNTLEYFIFLPIIFIIYWWVNDKSLKIQNILLLVASYYFYMSWNPVHGILLLAVTAVTYLGARLLQRMDCEQGKKKRNKKLTRNNIYQFLFGE